MPKIKKTPCQVSHYAGKGMRDKMSINLRFGRYLIHSEQVFEPN